MEKLIAEILNIRKELEIQEKFALKHNFQLEANDLNLRKSIASQIAHALELGQNEDTHSRLIDDLRSWLLKEK